MCLCVCASVCRKIFENLLLLTKIILNRVCVIVCVYTIYGYIFLQGTKMEWNNCQLRLKYRLPQPNPEKVSRTPNLKSGSYIKPCSDFISYPGRDY